jgi:hypothetical protein
MVLAESRRYEDAPLNFSVRKRNGVVEPAIALKDGRTQQNLGQRP